MVSEKSERIVYEICKSFIEKNVPEEAEFYELIWTAFQGLPENWERGMIEGQISEKHLTFLPETARSLLTPVVIGIVSGVLSRFLYDLVKKGLEPKSIPERTKHEISNMAISIVIKFNKDVSLGEEIAQFILEYFQL